MWLNTDTVWALPSWLGPLSPESRQNLTSGITFSEERTLELKSSLFHQKLELMQTPVLQIWGRVYTAQQLIRPPKLLPAMPQAPSVLPLNHQFSIRGISSFQRKSRQRSPLPPNLYSGSQEQVYQLFLSGVFQTPTTMISRMLPAAMSWVRVSCTCQAVPKAAWLSLKRFWPSCIKRTQYFLRVLSQQEGGRYRLHFLVFPSIFETMFDFQTILLSLGLKEGNISTWRSPPRKTRLLPNIHLESLRTALTLMVAFQGQSMAVLH